MKSSTRQSSLVKNKKGALGLGQAAAAFTIALGLIITLAITAIVLDNFEDATTAGSFARAAVTNGSTSIANASSLVPVLGIIIIAAVVITLVRLFQ